MNSVQGITIECEGLIELSIQIDRIDTFYAVKKLQLCLEAMNAEFKKNYYNELLLMEMKTQCNNAAIYLEYLISNYDGRLRERYLDRLEVINLLRNVKEIIKVEAQNNYQNRTLIGNMCCNYAQCNELVVRSKQIIFKLMSEDREMIETIRKQIVVYKKFNLMNLV